MQTTGWVAVAGEYAVVGNWLVVGFTAAWPDAVCHQIAAGEHVHSLSPTEGIIPTCVLPPRSF